MVYRFADYELDATAYDLRRAGRRLRLARQPMDVLLLLVERAGQLVSREDIAHLLWGTDVFVDLDAGIHTAILRIRQALADSRTSPAFIETVSGRGYRFVAPVNLDDSSRGVRNSAPGNLPTELTSFVGRAMELARLTELIETARLITLTGAGGVGKTRLAVRAGAAWAAIFPHGVWLVDLAALTAPDLIAPTIAATLGIRERAKRSTREALLEGLRGRHALIILDTCEHLIDACASLAEDLLRSAPQVRIITTSREALGIAGEVVYRVPSLSLPGTSSAVAAEWVLESEAMQLFVERAAAIDSTFVVDAQSLEAIARICRRLDGIPLALELAAARVVVLSLEQIESRLQDRFRLLTGGSRTTVARQRTLEAAVSWSHQLLSDAERRLLRRLSVFPASWTLEAAEQVCRSDEGDASLTLELLSRLVGKSLVALENDVEGRRRYRLLETVHQYGRERLLDAGEVDRLRDCHFHYVFREFSGAQSVLRGAGQIACLRRLRIEQENVRAALEWGFSSESLARHSAELAGALFWFWTKRGLFEEGKRWLEQAARTPVPSRVRARALIGLAHMQDFQGDHRGAALSADEALAAGREVGDAWAVSVGLFLQALATFELGHFDEARQHAEAARRAADAGCDPIEHGGPLLVLANLALIANEHDRAQQLYDESIEVHRRGSDAWGLAILLSVAAGLRIIRGDLAVARKQATEAMELSDELEDPRGVAWSLEVFAGVLAAAGNAGAAARVWGASDALLETAGGAVLPTIGWIRERHIGPVRLSLGAPAFEALRAEGRAMTVTETIDFVHQQARSDGKSVV